MQRKCMQWICSDMFQVFFFFCMMQQEMKSIPSYLWSLWTSSATRESQMPGCVSSARIMASCSSSAASGFPLLLPPFSFNCNKFRVLNVSQGLMTTSMMNTPDLRGGELNDQMTFMAVTSVNNGEKIVGTLCDKGFFGLSSTCGSKHSVRVKTTWGDAAQCFPLHQGIAPVWFAAPRAVCFHSESFWGRVYRWSSSHRCAGLLLRPPGRPARCRDRRPVNSSSKAKNFDGDVAQHTYSPDSSELDSSRDCSDFHLLYRSMSSVR